MRRNEIVPVVLTVRPLHQYVLRGRLEKPIPVAIAALVLGRLNPAIQDRDARAVVEVNSVSRKIENLDVVDPPVSHALEVRTRSMRPARGGEGIVGKLDSHAFQSFVLL